MQELINDLLEYKSVLALVDIVYNLMNAVFLIMMFVVITIDKSRDKKKALIKKAEIPMSDEIVLFYAALFFYNLFYTIIRLFNGSPVPALSTAAHASAFFYDVVGGLQLLLYLHVIDKYIAKKTENARLHNLVTFFRVVQGLNYVLLAMTPFTGVIFYFNEENQIIHSFGYYIWQGSTALALAFFAGVCIVERKKADPFIIRVVLTSALLPLASLIATMFSGVNLNGIFFVAVALVLFVLYENNKIKVTLNYAAELQKSQNELEQSNLKLLLAQIQPHFIYNSIMSLQAKSVDNPVLYQGIKSFGKYLRANFESLTDNPLVSFSDELNNIRAYIQLVTLNYGDKLKVEYDIEVEDFMLPMLSVEPLVENAVRYGIGTYEQGGVVRITVRDELSYILIAVEDDGSGGNKLTDAQKKRKGIGIENVQMRLKALDMGELTITQDEHGTRSEIRLKAEELENEDDNDR